MTTQSNRSKDLQGGGENIITGCIISLSQTNVVPNTETNLTTASVTVDTNNLYNGSGQILIADSKIYTLSFYFGIPSTNGAGVDDIGFKGFLKRTRSGSPVVIAVAGMKSSRTSISSMETVAFCDRYLQAGDILSVSVIHNYNSNRNFSSTLSVDTVTRDI